MPSTFRTAGDASFYNCYSLKNIWCKAQTPPTISDDEFSDSTYIETKLNVPTGCTEAYKTADTWKKFSQISEYDYAAGLKSVMTNNVSTPHKYIDNGKVVIVKSGRKFTTVGQAVK